MNSDAKTQATVTVDDSLRSGGYARVFCPIRRCSGSTNHRRFQLPESLGENRNARVVVGNGKTIRHASSEEACSRWCCTDGRAIAQPRAAGYQAATGSRYVSVRMVSRSALVGADSGVCVRSRIDGRNGLLTRCIGIDTRARVDVLKARGMGNRQQVRHWQGGRCSRHEGDST